MNQRQIAPIGILIITDYYHNEPQFTRANKWFKYAVWNEHKAPNEGLGLSQFLHTLASYICTNHLPL